MNIRRSDSGNWYADQVSDQPVSIRLTGPKDATATELHGYDPKCGLCWLGAAHSGDYHRKEIS